MKPVCPRCQSSVIYEMTDGNNYHPIEELLSPAALISLGVSLCRSLKVNPVFGLVAGTALAAAIELGKANTALPMLVNKQYRCDHCTHVFSVFN